MTGFDPGAWNQANPDEFNNAEAPPPGMYEILVQDAKAFTSKGGKDIVIIELKVATGPNAGHEWSEVFGFGSEGAVKVTKGTCARLGVDVSAPAIVQAGTPAAALEALDAELKQSAVGNWYTAKVEQNGDYRNTYIDQKITPTATTDAPANTQEFATAPAGAPAGADDDCPF